MSGGAVSPAKLRCSHNLRAFLLLSLLIVVAPATCHASLTGGIMDLVGGVFAIPMGILQGTFGGPPIIGTIGGALQGTLQAVALTTRGALELVGVALPLAAKIAPLIPLFL